MDFFTCALVTCLLDYLFITDSDLILELKNKVRNENFFILKNFIRYYAPNDTFLI